jgi:hypothetical protein
MSTEETPFIKTINLTKEGLEKLDGIQQRAGEKTLNIANSVNEGVRRIIRFDDPGDPSTQPLLLPPKGALDTVGDVADATILNPTRRVWEITSSTGSAVKAAYRTLTRPLPFFHMKETLFHPINYLKNPARLVTSTVKLGSEIINAPTRTLDEIVSRGIKRPLKRIGDKIPYLGKPISIIGGAAGWIANQPRRLTEYLTSPIEKADNWMREKQNG